VQPSSLERLGALGEELRPDHLAVAKGCHCPPTPLGRSFASPNAAALEDPGNDLLPCPSNALDLRAWLHDSLRGLSEAAAG
jgi:hypothetical protein